MCIRDRNYTKKYGHAPDQFAAAAYDGVYMAMDAVQRAGSVTDTRKIRDAIIILRYGQQLLPHAYLRK